MSKTKGEELRFTLYKEKGSPPLEASRIAAYIPLLSDLLCGDGFKLYIKSIIVKKTRVDFVLLIKGVL